MNTVWIVSELFYPEETSTGYFLTVIATGLALDRRMAALCGQPTYSKRGIKAPAREYYEGISIFRCSGTTLNKDRPLSRVLNTITVSFSILWNALWRLRADDYVIVVTNPPLLPFLVAIACWLRRAKCILLIHDVYPEIFVMSGVAKSSSHLVKLVASARRLLYRGMGRIVVLGRDMEALIRKELSSDPQRVVIIPNWGDTESVFPMRKGDNRLLQAHGLTSHFVVQYSGNMGRTHDVEVILEAACVLVQESVIHFLFIGSGRKAHLVEAASRTSENITFLAPRGREQLGEVLTASDVAIISFVPGMSGLSVPSRMYNVMAAGCPIIGVCDESSELAMVIREERIGWVVLPGDVPGLAALILRISRAPDLLAEMGHRARRAAEQLYTAKQAVARYSALLASLDPAQLHGSASSQPNTFSNLRSPG